jgi:Protein of unknown function (DUF3108)
VAAAIGLLVLAGHAWLLLGLPPGLGGDPVPGLQPVLQTRQIVVAAAAPPAVEPSAAPAPEPVAAAPAPVVAAVPPAAASGPKPPPEPPAEAASAPVVEAPQALVEAPTGPASGPTGPAADAGGQQVPVYATRLPPPARLAFELRRGLLSGNALLVWAPDAQRYEMSLEGGAFGQTLLGWTSRGAIDAHGIAPERFTDRRGRRAEQAANFRRDVGKISYSGPTVEYPLPAGMQDRLSWMVQLPAILEANPALREPGQRIELFISGARGDADVWTFVVQGRADLDLPAGPVSQALHLLRAPRKPFDTQAEAWLDPARGHLPVRARLSTPDRGDGTDLLLTR